MNKRLPLMMIAVVVLALLLVPNQMTGVATAQPTTPLFHQQPLPWIELLRHTGPLWVAERKNEVSLLEDFLPSLSQKQSQFEAIDACIQGEMADKGVPGAAIAIALDGEMVYERGYGVKHSQDGGIVDKDTIFRIGSVTKMMTAAAVMQQVDEGKVDLQAPVTTYVPEFDVAGPWPASNIKVWHLLTHSTGLPEQVPDIAGPTTETALTDWVTSQSDVQLFAEPGSFWNYCNQNFCLAGLVAERASNMSYHEYMKSQLWDRADMTRTTLLPAAVMADGNYSHGHLVNPFTGEPIVDPGTGEQIIFAPDAYDNWWFAPAGFAFSTAGDLVKFAQALMDGGGNVLSPESAAAMQDEQIALHSVPDQYYGFGIMGEDFWGVETKYHGGNVSGWGTWLLWVPERNFAVATVGNTTVSMTRSAYCATIVMLGLEPPEPQDYTTDPTTWGRYTGTYEVVDYELFGLLRPAVEAYQATITQEDERLRLSIDLPDPLNPTVPFSRTLTQGYLDTFFYDFDLDGQIQVDLTFIGNPENHGPTKWIRNRRFVGTQAPVPAGTYAMSARAFVDYRCDGFFQDGLDIPLRDATISLRFPNGARALYQVRPFGLVNFSGFDIADRVAIRVNLPERFRGYALNQCANSWGNLRLAPDDFEFGYKALQFGVRVTGEQVSP